MSTVVVTASMGERSGIAFYTPTVDRRADGIRYLAFSARGIRSRFWETVKVPRVYCDPCRDAKRFKVFAANYAREIVPDVSRVIWIDRHCRLALDPLSIFDDFTEPVGVVRHPRGCLYREARACITKEKDDPGLIRKTVERWRLEKFPARAGLYYGGFLAMRVGEEQDEFSRLWWNYIESGSRRDQLSLPVALRRYGAGFHVWKSHGPLFSVRGK